MNGTSGLAELRSQQQALQALTLGAGHDVGLGREAAPGTCLRGEAGLAVYQAAYLARLLSALRDNYAVLHLAMGDEAFEALGLAYAAAHPSAQPSIRWFGHALAEFMASEEAGALSHPALLDFARMDWALRAAFDGPDAPPLAFERLAALAPEAWPSLRFTLHPTVQLLTLDWAIEAAWLALRAEQANGPAPEHRPHNLLVWRQGLETRWRSLEACEAALIAALQAPHSFESICCLAAQFVGEAGAAAAVVRALQAWVAQGLLADALGASAEVQSRAS
ncbi:DNA-binding domain-containing protein [Paucibacter sp. AS339]|uniref:DNA-binding domain-containing protein n=1 Tax=Paucibacter hankyongi TaxID=3133434 RepID=UPI0030A5ADC5